MANIGTHYGKIVAITAIAHSTYSDGVEWHFVGRCEWRDGSHQRDPDREYDIPPDCLCPPDDGDRADLDKALDALHDYLKRNGSWDGRGHWKPHVKSGREEFTL